MGVVVFWEFGFFLSFITALFYMFNVYILKKNEWEDEAFIKEFKKNLSTSIVAGLVPIVNYLVAIYNIMKALYVNETGKVESDAWEVMNHFNNRAVAKILSIFKTLS